MIISVISPLHQVGRTVTSTMVAASLAYVGGRQTCLTHVDFSDAELNGLLGIDIKADVTTALSHIVKLLENESLKGDEILRYFQSTENKKMYVFTSPPTEISEEDLLDLYSYFLKKLSIFNYIVIDLDSMKDSEVTRQILRESDIVIIVGNTDDSCVEQCRKLRDDLHKIYGLQGQRYIFAINKYTPIIRSYQKIANHLGVNKNSIININYNTNIAIAKNNGNFIELIERASIKEKGHIGIWNNLMLINKLILYGDKKKKFGFF